MHVQVTEKLSSKVELSSTGQEHLIAFKAKTNSIKIKMSSAWTMGKKSISHFQKDDSRANPGSIFNGL